MSRLMALRRFLLLLGATLLAWRVFAIALSSHYAQLADEDAEAATKALAWNNRQPEALYRRALHLQEDDPAAAASLLARAYAENPAAVRPLVVIAELSLQQGDNRRSEALLDAAVELSPADPWVHEKAAEYWIGREDLVRTLRHWSIALEIDSASRSRLFPIMLKLADDPSTRLAFKRFAALPPSWWEAFFTMVAADAADVETVRVLYTLRRDSHQVPVSEIERQAYVARMKRSGFVAEAYVDWVSGLDRQQRERLGLLYNGSFEIEPSNWGFDWRIRSSPKALVHRGTTYGIDGAKALHLIFRDYEKRFEGVSQYLFLDPGPYRLSGRMSTDSLESRGGLKWSVYCMVGEPRMLGASDRFLGGNEWRDFAFEFEVPEYCTLQEIRLRSAGKRRFEYGISGGAWFDRLIISKVPKLAGLPKVAPTAAAETPDADKSNSSATSATSEEPDEAVGETRETSDH